MKYTSDIVKGIVASIIDDYKENRENKIIDEIQVHESEHNFKVKIWYAVSEEWRDFYSFTVCPDHSIKAIRQLTESCMESINPFKESVTV